MDFTAILAKADTIAFILMAVLVGLPLVLRGVQGLLHSLRLTLTAIPGDQKEALIEKVEIKLESLVGISQKIVESVSRVYAFLFPGKALPKVE